MFIESGKPNARLALALNTEWLAAKLAHALWREDETPATIRDIAVEQIRETKKGVTVLYEMTLNGARLPAQRQMYVGHLVPSDRLAEEHASVLKKAKAQPLHGRTVVIVPEVDLILSAFPNDRKLKLISEDDLRAWLADHLREVAEDLPRGSHWQVRAIKMEVLRYVPERRFTARCRVTLSNEAGVEKEISFIAKQLTDAPKARRLYNNLRALQSAWLGQNLPEAPYNNSPLEGGQGGVALDLDHGARHDSRESMGSKNGIEQFDRAQNTPLTPLKGGIVEEKGALLRANPPLRIPRAFAWEEKQAVVFIEDLPGENLKQLLFEIALAPMMHKAGAALADFHRAKKRVRKRVTLKSELRENRRAIGIIAKAFPQQRASLKKLLRELRDSMWHERAPEVLLHGTYRLNHIFLLGDELALLDLDSLRLGPAAYDLANFLSSLYYLEAQERIDPAMRRNIARHFLEGYVSRCASGIAPLAVLWFFASLLLNKQASKYVTHFHDDREAKMLRMVELAETTLQLCRSLPEDATCATLWKILP